MLLPKKVKHRKWHKLRRRGQGVATRFTSVAFGDFGLSAQSHGWVTSRQIEAARRVLTRYVRRGGKVWIRIFPDRPITKKGNELPMGGGKGAPEQYVCTIKPGSIMFEIGGISPKNATEALKLAGHKLSVKSKVVDKK
ncbi:MAG TPA: 50S ribosomal protein L16 [Candidatus Magasanikbacteria bacterium]|nr:MAG: 50S ribosomal protein L16 [Candidatus Magasanikbacteria bacterium RIFCSPLOWO2_02_FULL_47_16]OGH79322.1 MAG: 50S ribosomal protein L16 [Candidatus Magasanikbacteria bacterium RIFCSPHIGHO2_02_FULL_48_18]OGH81883.1 MAG: 50S ribosomal protein L16 [Candidatus Magasanikbacteria bacterium RIFCSPLOWO2_12_FULL_47_9b]HAZ28436.1 50S ribosomal protein L16 [Candidatus Magasanikbacteria bacterium]